DRAAGGEDLARDAVEGPAVEVARAVGAVALGTAGNDQPVVVERRPPARQPARDQAELLPREAPGADAVPRRDQVDADRARERAVVERLVAGQVEQVDA